MERGQTAVFSEPAVSGLLCTPAELESHRCALERLVEIRDRDLPQLLREARGLVSSDAEEEIVQIKQDQTVVEARIGHLEQLLRGARVLAEKAAPGVVSVGSRVRVEDVSTGKVVTYQVTGTALSAGNRVLSAGSPVGRALMGHVAGDTVDAVLPAGRIENLRIVSVEPSEEAPWA
jgi:transcription elongation factor GreA